MMMPAVIRMAVKAALQRFARAPVHFELVVQLPPGYEQLEVVLSLSAAELARLCQPGAVITVREAAATVAEITL